jgi:hypothetical protein
MCRKRKVDPFEINVEEEILGDDFKAEQVIVQLRKVVDSGDGADPIHWVHTDKGGKVWVATRNARLIVKLFNRITNEAATNGGYVSNRVRPEYIAAQTKAKAQLIESMQTAAGLRDLVKFVRENANAI